MLWHLAMFHSYANFSNAVVEGLLILSFVEGVLVDLVMGLAAFLKRRRQKIG